jgi:NAD(P)-dependent dehydrogenase (short-subunit alcohol dehydrogenase family)
MKVLVTGAASGLGAAIVTSLENVSQTVYKFDKSIDIRMDVKQANTDYLNAFFGYGVEVDALINCAGVNQNEWFEDVSRKSFNHVMDVNCWGQINMAQAVLPLMRWSPHKCIINIVSNAASKPMTASLAYNCSKAAAKMATMQMAHELTPRYGITVLSVSPNKLAGTAMSKQIDEEVVRVRGWTPEYAAEYQKKSLMHGQETPPWAVAEFITDLLISGRYKYLSGCDVPFGS